ncbi:hypothetical protein MSIMFI_05518 [Mycobacterium simulans]|nr:hypothetical protein MSIMFI_05518 [Mycobacterium simulans]
MVKVLTLVGDLAMTRSDSLPTLLAVVRPALCSAQPLLRRRQLVRRCAAPARVVDVLTVTGGGETRDADIDPNLAAGDRQWIGWHVVARQHQHPAPALAFDLDSLDPARHLAVQLHLDLADAL